MIVGGSMRMATQEIFRSGLGYTYHAGMGQERASIKSVGSHVGLFDALFPPRTAAALNCKWRSP